MIEIGIGLLIIAIGSFGQSSSYVPINKIRDWSWESFWLVQGIFAWLVFPYLGAMLAVPEGSTLLELWCSPGSLGAVIYGMLWGVGGLTFGLSMRYLGVALGQSIALGTCAGFGTLFPALFGGTNLFEGTGLILLTGVCRKRFVSWRWFDVAYRCVYHFSWHCDYRLCRKFAFQKYD